MEDAKDLIERLALVRHPEGGWYRETWRAAPVGSDAPRGAATAILFLLEAGQRSHWHRVDAAELWVFQAGAPLTLLTSVGDAGPIRMVRLGVQAGDTPQHLIPAREWQAAEASPNGWTLVTCVVVPAFEFGGFELAPEGWAPGR
jgi:predicted cupin superfamily sugar epimerase